ncbi:S-layer homology domain-containing protein [Anaerotignum lactatifermentans]
MRKRLFAAFVCLCMMVSLLPTMVFAETGIQDSGTTIGTSGLCEYHTQHDDVCGYTEGTAEVPCSHEHTEDCYTLVTNCVHEHTAECYSEESTEPICGHVCSEESGCITKELNCNHEHDGNCGYVLATEGTPCTFVCEVCNPQDNGDAATPSDAQPEECTCETLCTDEEINGDCPVCSAEGAELDKVCVGVTPMLPVMALAVAVDAPQTLYVAGQVITDEGYYTQSGDSWTKSSDTSTPPSAPYFHYTKGDNNTPATLTLSGATIQGGTSTVPVPYGAGIYAQCKNRKSVSLTIELIGNNTITGYYGIYMDAQQGDTLGANASLNITGDGSLTVTNTDSHGLFVKGGTGNASLNIEKATVTSSTDGEYAAGVNVQSSANATGSPNISLSVNGGSLTASGTGNSDGIQFYVGASEATNATTSLIVTDNAIVDAKNGGISAKQTSNPINTDISAIGSSGGIVFNGNTGTVYGDVELQEDLDIGEGESLTLDDDASLSAGDHNVIVDGGTLDENLANSLDDSVKYAPTIVTPPADKSVTEGETATFTVNATGTEPLSHQWQQSADNGSSWTDITGETNATYTIATTTTNMSGTQYHCVVKNSIGEVTSNAATLTVNAIPTYTITVKNDGHGTASATPHSAKAGEKITLTATPNSGYRFSGWTSSDNITFANAGSAQTTFTMQDKAVTITANWKKKSSGGSVFFWGLKFDTNGGSDIDTVTEWEYSTIDLDEYVPEKEGYKFVGWYADKDFHKKIDEVYLTEDTTVYAKWEKIAEEVPEEPEETEETETISFKDVKESDWFYEAVSYAVENGLMSGMSEDIFAPNTPLTREMLAVVLYNVEGQPESAGVNPFIDVKADMWYTEAILWANENGIVAGYDNGAYGVGDLITREQFATILYRYAQFKGYDVSIGADTNILSYADAFAISEYAYPAMQWACGAGIMGGMDDGTLMPQGKATRAEAATMLMNFCKNVVK